MKRASPASPTFMLRLLLAALVWFASWGAADARTLRLVALGDSITAGLGVPPAQAMPAQLERVLRARGHDVSVENAGVSGDTASAGRDRLDWSVPEGTDAVIVALGGNDVLRAVPPAVTEAALDDILSRLATRRIPVLLIGMLAPRSLGPDYVSAFDALFPRLAAKHGVLFHPFLLDGVAADPAFNQRDGIHPNARGVGVIVERMAEAVERLLERAKMR